MIGLEVRTELRPDLAVLLDVAYEEIEVLKAALRKAWRERDAALDIKIDQEFDFEKIQRRAIFAALAFTGYNQLKTAKMCGISRGKLNYMLREMGVRHASWRVHTPDACGVRPLEGTQTPLTPAASVPSRGHN